MLKGERLYNMAEYIDDKKVVTIMELCDHFKVSKATVNRDLRMLEKEKFITRTHGGAMSLTRGTRFEPIYEIKEKEKIDEKQAIGAYAVNFIKQGETILLDSGTTTLLLARQMKDLNNITVITNDLMIAYVLSEANGIDLVVLGGQHRKGVYSLIGPFTENILKELNVDKAFLGADAIDVDRGITNSNIEESNIKKSIVEISKEVIVLADSSKFGNVAFTKVCDIDSVDVIVTDFNISEKELSKFRNTNVKIYIAEKKSV
jgi:DeoR/GlpR family transcriptional regulator of sugar metabolism